MMTPFVATLVAGIVLFGGESSPAIASTPPDACTSPVGGPVKPAVVPSRISGVAPLAVFFDATGTTASTTPRPFHDLEYRWDFGDPAAGATWAAGSRPKLSSRNSATGPVAAHVFEAPGIYTVTLTVNTAKSSCVITVQDPDAVFSGASTICFSTSGDFTGCPAGAEQFKTSDFAAVTNAANAYNKTRRLLLRRGETWTAAKSAVLKASGPGIVGAFGAGAAPVVDAIVNGVVLQLSGANDWRIMDLNIVGNGGTGQRGFRNTTVATRITFLRISTSNLAIGFLVDIGQSADMENTFADLNVVNSGSYGLFVGGTRLAILGSIIRNVGTEHIFRSAVIVKGVISNNEFSGGVAGKSIVKLNAPKNGTGLSEQIVISDNELQGGGTHWTANLGPQSGNPPNNNEIVRQAIVERNWFRAGARTQRALVINASEITVRNNICDMTRPGGTGATCFAVFTQGAEPAPDNVHVYNNTGYSADSGDFSFIHFADSTATNVTVQNNLASAPRSTRARMIHGTPASGLVQSNNSSDSQVVSLVPGWIVPAPKTPAEFKLGPESRYIDAGFAVPVFSDFFRTSRPRGAQIDIGAAERER